MTRDEAYIAQRSDARYVKIVDLEDQQDPAISMMATFGSKQPRHFVHVEKMPLRKNWRERAIAHFINERERA